MKVDIKNSFIKKACKIHGDKYDYSKVNYIDSHTKVCIICPIHGEFWQTPNSHLNGCGCSKCSRNKRMTNEEFIEQAKKIHSDKYDYSKVQYVNANTKVCVICPEHGEFFVTPSNHLRARGCPKCKTRKNVNKELILSKKRKIKQHTTESFIEKAKKVHGNRYDYSKVNYINNHTKVCIICPEHGEFWQKPNNHLNGMGCKKCSDIKRFNNRKISIEDWINTANKIHNNKYDYSKVNYINANTKVCIICPEHGEFWQKPSSHLSGKGCPTCNDSILEKKVISLLTEENIKYYYRYRPIWLNGLELDFYLPDYNIAIECQGEQHFNPVEHFGGVERFKKQIENDIFKKEKCIENNITLLYFSNFKKEKMITNINILKETIYEANSN